MRQCALSAIGLGRRTDAAGLLGVEAVARDGAVVRADGALVRLLAIGGCLEQVQHVSVPPERTWVGWPLHAMQSPDRGVIWERPRTWCS